ncbi:unnamed protein product [Pleuronectes platessa]|uniref:Uncharacterized protein n=1 Tax=Pleuronectes platessa TaxID=8262 RepID=A0A9N7VCX3_PLEPL|nr:unnamed protein product [Pleuronectes platessa]
MEKYRVCDRTDLYWRGVLTARKGKAACFQSKSADEEACVAVKIEHSRALGSSPAGDRSSAPSVQACLNRASRGTNNKSRGGVNGRAPSGRPRLQSKPEVPPKPLHLQSPVTDLSSPLGRTKKPSLRRGMEEGGGGRGGGVGGGGGGGGKTAVSRERAKEKHSKVSDLISRFEENSGSDESCRRSERRLARSFTSRALAEGMKGALYKRGETRLLIQWWDRTLGRGMKPRWMSGTENKRDSSPHKPVSKSTSCSPAHRPSPKPTESDRNQENRPPAVKDEHKPAANGVVAQMEPEKEKEIKSSKRTEACG